MGQLPAKTNPMQFQFFFLLCDKEVPYMDIIHSLQQWAVLKEIIKIIISAAMLC